MPFHTEHRKRNRAAQQPEGSAEPELDPADKLEQAKRLLREVGYFVAFLVAALLTANLPLPFFIGSALLNLGAVICGVRVLRAGRKGGLTPFSLALFGFGVLLTVLMALSSISLLTFWSEQMELQDCLRNSVTLQGQDVCRAVFNDAIAQRLSGLIPGFSP